MAEDNIGGISVGIGEVARRLEKLDMKMDREFRDLRGFGAENFVNKEVYETRHTQLEEKIEAAAESMRWFRRAVFGAVIAVLVPIIILAVTIKESSGK